MFLDFFESKDHLVLKSFSLVPRNDNSLLLINSGMAPLKPYFTGQEIPPSKRVVTCQKCIRTGDIENVGKTARHGTFFEMLGNFSFGDYFKRESLAWSWEFLTEVVGLDADRLYPSVYLEDQEAYDIWNKEMGIAADRIFKFGKEDNYWEHGAGPCGPCSEIYYDRGEKYGCDDPDCTVGCECDRYIEIWNNVFTQFESDGNNHYVELDHKNIDTGMGLERLAVIVQDVPSLFDVDTLVVLRDKICELAGVKYNKEPETDVSIRLITDHIRSATFMISDGVMPSNEGRGYVLRRLIRRAARHGRLLGIKGQFLSALSKTVIVTSKDGYPELDEKKDFIFKVLTQEEEKFSKTIDQGLAILEDMQAQMKKNNETMLSGDDAFKLYDTYGFPIDLTKEIFDEIGLSIDEEGFKKAMENQRVTARNARKTSNYMGADVTVYESIDPSITSEFIGYTTLKSTSEIAAMTNDNEITKSLTEGERGTIIVAQTPFYPTMGGQVGDKGVISTKDSEFMVEDTIKLTGDKIGHVGVVTKGMFTVTDSVDLQVAKTARAATCKNHSATHLLQKALKTVLGSHVEQAGSLVSADRLRFDFSHFEAMTKDEINKVEQLVNEQIEANLPVLTQTMNIDDAKKSGAMALFGEKYEDDVRVVSMGDVSKELCGGTHVSNTGEIGLFKIVSEAGIAAGVRRIEALTGKGAIAYFEKLEEILNSVSVLAKTEPGKLSDRIQSYLEEIKQLQSENDKLKNKLASDSVGDVMSQVIELNGFKVLPVKMEGIDMNALRNLGDDLKQKIGTGVVILASSENNEKVTLLAMATDDAVKAGIHAGNLIKAIAPCVGGGGGGRPNMAQAGGKNPQGIEQALEQAKEVVKDQLN